MNGRILYIKKCEKEYKQLLEINDFPTYEIEYKEVSQKDSDDRGYGALGASRYDYKTGKHTLVVWSNIHTLGEAGKQTIFHEFTHILDDEFHVNKNAEKYVANHGYTEYHASQIGFLKVLGVQSIKQHILFSMRDFIDTESGYMTIQDYVNAPILLANELINRIDFPNNFEMLKDTMGVIFNYYGRRSICKMYSNDFQDSADTSVIAKLITPTMVTFLNTYLTKWLTNPQISVLGNFYKDIFMALVNRYNI